MDGYRRRATCGRPTSQCSCITWGSRTGGGECSRHHLRRGSTHQGSRARGAYWLRSYNRRSRISRGRHRATQRSGCNSRRRRSAPRMDSRYRCRFYTRRSSCYQRSARNRSHNRRYGGTCRGLRGPRATHSGRSNRWRRRSTTRKRTTCRRPSCSHSWRHGATPGSCGRGSTTWTSSR